MDRYSDRHLGVCYFIILFLFCMRFTIAGVETQKKRVTIRSQYELA